MCEVLLTAANARLSGEHGGYRTPDSAAGHVISLSEHAFSSLSIPLGSRISTTLGVGIDERNDEALVNWSGGYLSSRPSSVSKCADVSGVVQRGSCAPCSR